MTAVVCSCSMLLCHLALGRAQLLTPAADTEGFTSSQPQGPVLFTRFLCQHKRWNVHSYVLTWEQAWSKPSPCSCWGKEEIPPFWQQPAVMLDR